MRRYALPTAALSMLVFVVGLTTTACAATPAIVTGCRASSLQVSFSQVPGSAGAGQITYALQIRNTSSTPCLLGGRPVLLLESAKGTALPTKVVPDSRSSAPGKVLELADRKSVWSSARFSPDVPGPGEQNLGQCEPTASFVRVSGAKLIGAVRGRIITPTAVCEHGTMQVSVLGISRPTT